MNIETPEGTLVLADHAKPSHNDKTDILASLTRDGMEFQAVCDAASEFRDDTVANFHADAAEWVRRRAAALAVLRSLPDSHPVSLPSAGEMTSAEADAVSILAGEHASSWARARNRWEWTAGELVDSFAPKEVR